MIKLVVLGGITTVFGAKGCIRQSGNGHTPPEVEGPFYPVVAQKDKDFDLTRIEGRDGMAEGEQVIIMGQVIDIEGRSIEDTSVDLWQANAKGRYRHPHDSNPSPLDPNFQGWAIVQSGQNGGFRFKTVKPGEYPASDDWIRPPHIHFKISKKGFIELTTQMYFPGEKRNENDLLFKRKSASEQRLSIAQRENTEDGLEVYQYNIILEKA